MPTTFTYASGLPQIMPIFSVWLPMNADGSAGSQYMQMFPLGVSGPSGFGVPIVVGMSPEEVSAFLGVPIRVNPTYAESTDVPCVIVFNQTLGNTTLAAPFNVGSGTIGGAGAPQTWGWACSCELYVLGTGKPKDAADLFAFLVGSYTGTGAAQTIPLPFTPDAVFVKPVGGAGTPNPGGGGYRQNGMPFALASGGSVQKTDGIGPVGPTGIANGFTLGTGQEMNKSGTKYGFLAMVDPNSQHMMVSQYVGAQDHTVSGVVTTLNSSLVNTATDQFVFSDGGLMLDFGPNGQYLFAYVDPRHGTIDPMWTSAGNTSNPTFRVANRKIPTALPHCSHVWIFGRIDVYSNEVDFPMPGAVTLTSAAQSQTDLVTGFFNDSSGHGFLLGNSNNVAAAAQTFYYVAMNIDDALKGRAFRSGQVTQSGAAHTISGIPFQPAWIVTQQYVSFQVQACWRQGGQQIGTKSNNYGDITGTGVIDQTTGITAITSDGFTTGTPQADNGVAGRMVWYTFAGSFTSSDPSPGPSPGALAPTCPGTSGRTRWPYAAALSATGGTTPYNWSIPYGSLPPGLIVDPVTGVIGGTPTTVGTYAFTIRVMDATMAEALISSCSCSITITDDGTSPDGGPPPKPPGPITPPEATGPHGWWQSDAGFRGDVHAIGGWRPADPRSWKNFSGFATGSAAMLGGSPGIAAMFRNRMIYAASGYVVGTDAPPVNIFDGQYDRQLTTIPPTSAGASHAVVSIIAANGTLYLATWDAGTDKTTWVGRVFSLDIESATLTPIGAPLPTGYLPYALAFLNGSLFCGTQRQDPTVSGRVYTIRPGVDTAWTQDYDLSTVSQGSVAALVNFNGSLYVGTTAPAGTFAKILKRAADGTYSAVETGSGGTAVANNCYLSLAVFKGSLYAGFWNNDATAISKVRKSADGATWTTAFTGSAGTLRPVIVLTAVEGWLYAIGGGLGLTAAIVATQDGAAWLDLTPQLPETDKTALPATGVVVL